MAVIGMIGPHAVGKTTALARWLERYGSNRLETYSLDAERNRFPGNVEKQELVAWARVQPKVVVIESARGFAGWVGAMVSGEPLLVLTCPEPTGRSWMVERRGGKPLTDYWTPKRLDYEYNGYPLNYVRKRPDLDVKHFIIEDRERDWVAVDEWFGATFRRLHNALIANRH